MRISWVTDDLNAPSGGGVRDIAGKDASGEAAPWSSIVVVGDLARADRVDGVDTVPHRRR
uniref:Uncharacterized protein n=1 Tax=Oryza sativa subsp. japonica TaxID=39947 RepID=Q6YY40_ORYSJ|nr:hypothetical protein [Oryza sativa Japonica Group]BAD17460.1 hypothetical protein [Oryza sativa Japonica Group]